MKHEMTPCSQIQLPVRNKKGKQHKMMKLNQHPSNHAIKRMRWPQRVHSNKVGYDGLLPSSEEIPEPRVALLSN
jgi:hypothetical protein